MADTGDEDGVGVGEEVALDVADGVQAGQGNVLLVAHAGVGVAVQAVDGYEHAAADAGGVERGLVDLGQLGGVLAEVLVEAHVAQLVVAVEGGLQDGGVAAHLLSQLLDGVAAEEDVVVHLLLQLLVEGLGDVGLPGAVEAVGLVAQQVLGVVAVKDGVGHAAGLLGDGEGLHGAVHVLAGEALAVGVDGQPAQVAAVVEEGAALGGAGGEHHRGGVGLLVASACPHA